MRTEPRPCTLCLPKGSQNFCCGLHRSKPSALRLCSIWRCRGPSATPKWTISLESYWILNRLLNFAAIIFVMFATAFLVFYLLSSHTDFTVFTPNLTIHYMKLHSTLLYMYYVLYCLSVSVLYLCMWPCCAFCEKKFQKTKAWNADI